MTQIDQVPASETKVAQTKRHPWSRAEVRFGTLCVALILAALAISHVMNAGHPAKGAPFGAVTYAPVVAGPHAPPVPHS